MQLVTGGVGVHSASLGRTSMSVVVNDRFRDAHPSHRFSVAVMRRAPSGEMEFVLREDPEHGTSLRPHGQGTWLWSRTFNSTSFKKPIVFPKFGMTNIAKMRIEDNNYVITMPPDERLASLRAPRGPNKAKSSAAEPKPTLTLGEAVAFINKTVPDTPGATLTVQDNRIRLEIIQVIE